MYPLEPTAYPTGSPDTSTASIDDGDILEFGPIKVKPRKKPAPTLATGRRSKYEILCPEEEQRRDVRRARNRAAAERVRVNRLGVEQELLSQIDALQVEENALQNHVTTLQYHKLHLEARLGIHDEQYSTMHPSDATSQSNVDASSVFPTNRVTYPASNYNLDDLFPDLSSSAFNSVSHSSAVVLLGDDLDAFLID